MENAIIETLHSGLRVAISNSCCLAVFVYCMTKILKKRHSFIWMIVHGVLKLVLQNFVFLPAETLYPECEIIRTVKYCYIVLSMIGLILIYWYTFDEKLIKSVYVAQAVELILSGYSLIAIAAVNKLQGDENLLDYTGRWNRTDFLTIFFWFLMFLAVRPVCRKYGEKIKSYQMKHVWLMGSMFAVWFLIGGVGRMIKSYGIYLSVVNVIIFLISVGLMAVILGVQLYYFYQKRVRAEYDMLVMQQRLMESHYAGIQVQIRKMEENQQLIDRQMEEISQWDQHLIKDQAIEKYLGQLKSIYQDFHCGMYSDRWLVDAVLCYQEKICRENGIETDFGIAGYDEKRIPENEMSRMILQMIDFGIDQCRKNSGKNGEKPEIRLHIGTVKNQTVIEFSCPGSGKARWGRILKKEYIEKYGVLVAEKG